MWNVALIYTAWLLRSRSIRRVMCLHHEKTHFPRFGFVLRWNLHQKSKFSKIDSESINLRQKVILREKDRARATEVISKHVVPVGEFTPAEITIVEYKPNEVKLDVRTQFPGWLVINDHYLPGWGCDVDGREVPIFQANGIFRAVYLPSGHHQVRYWFWPQRLSLGLTIAAVSLVFGVYGLTRRDSKSIVTTKAEKGRQKVSV
jgi:hypothetical protein